MKKLLFAVVSALTLLSTSAQDLKQAKKQIDKKDWTGAKATIDQLVGSDKTNKDFDVWYAKGQVYSKFATDSSLKGQVPGANMIALAAFDKAYTIDSGKTKVAAALDGNFSSITNLYGTTFNEAYRIFQKNDFATALPGFSNADSIGRFLYTHHIALTALDTVVTYYLGFCYMKMEKNDSATYYFQKLGDAHVSGQNFDLPYNWLVYYYSDKKGLDHGGKICRHRKNLLSQGSIFQAMSSCRTSRKKEEARSGALQKKYKEIAGRKS